LYGNKELQPTVVAIGKTDEWLAIRIGPWLYQVKLGKELRFPNVTHHLQSPTGAVARLQIAPADAQFLAGPPAGGPARSFSLDISGSDAAAGCVSYGEVGACPQQPADTCCM
jgi:hypothetical protein